MIRIVLKKFNNDKISKTKDGILKMKKFTWNDIDYIERSRLPEIRSVT